MDMRLHASNQAKHLLNESVYRSPLLHFIDAHSEILGFQLNAYDFIVIYLSCNKTRFKNVY